jgi:F-type H+-transporting ATPase subunit alpha
LITQPRFTPLRPVDEVALLAALADGVFDALPVEGCIVSMRARLAAHLDAHGGTAAAAALAETGALDVTTQAGLVAAVRDLAQQVVAAPTAEVTFP